MIEVVRPIVVKYRDGIREKREKRQNRILAEQTHRLFAKQYRTMRAVDIYRHD